MPENNRPKGRDTHVTNNSKGVHKRGEGLGTGPVGSKDGYADKKSSGTERSGASSSGEGGPRRSSGGTRGSSGGGLMKLILILIVALVGGGGGLSMLTGSDSDSTASDSSYSAPAVSTVTDNTSSGSDTTGSSDSSYDLSQTMASYYGGMDLSELSSLFGYDQAQSMTGTSSSWSSDSNTGSLNTEVASTARDKYTTIKGDGTDQVTIMVYMCGTDLESKNGMGTSDLSEMANAKYSDNVNVLVYTGGCKSWRTSSISSSTNQIYRVVEGGLERLVSDDGNKVMTEPSTLTGFINYCQKNYPANRNMLILWDHGGGSISGYGYDEKHSSAGSMSLDGIDTAIGDSGMKFDFIGFDACLMATTENALMLSKYADYLVASEETEPGLGWYYTNWLTSLSSDPSMSTVEIGKNIIDDFVDVSKQKCQGQSTTLSIVDLAELEETAPEKLTAFAENVTEMIEGKEYSTVASARTSSREFAKSSQIDQVDLINLAQNIGTDESKALADTLLAAVKYNRTSSDMTNSYGLSIYFPYKKLSYVDRMVSTYNQIGMDSAYTKCIQQYASMSASGQAVSGGYGSAYSSLYGYGSSGSSGSSSSGGSYSDPYASYGSSYGGSVSSEVIGELLNQFLSGRSLPSAGLDESNTQFLSERAMSDEDMTQYLTDNRFDTDQLVWTKNDDGKNIMTLSEDQWKLVRTLDQNLFFDDGEGYIDLGLDNAYSFDENGALIGDTDRTWLAINGQPVAYYHLDTVEDGDQYKITGRVPAYLNGDRVDLILVFDNDHPNGYIAGALTDYVDGDTETVAKLIAGEEDEEGNVGEVLKDGDTLDFVCDYYAYDGTYQDSYYLGEQMVIDGTPEISNVDVGEGGALVTYRFTDIYGQTYWTPAISE